MRRLIRHMWNSNPTWGAPRIQAELHKLGIDVSYSTLRRYRPPRPGHPSQTWRSFLKNHLSDIVALDFFVVPTATDAGGGTVVSSVVRSGLLLVVLGLAVGGPGSLVASRLVTGLLFGVGTTDPVTYVGVAVFLGAVATVACLLPPWRAARTDPVVAFRIE